MYLSLTGDCLAQKCYTIQVERSTLRLFFGGTYSPGCGAQALAPVTSMHLRRCMREFNLSRRFTQVSLAATANCQNTLRVACEAVQKAKSPSLFWMHLAPFVLKNLVSLVITDEICLNRIRLLMELSHVTEKTTVLYSAAESQSYGLAERTPSSF